MVLLVSTLHRQEFGWPAGRCSADGANRPTHGFSTAPQQAHYFLERGKQAVNRAEIF
jgi:hypothetical protein